MAKRNTPAQQEADYVASLTADPKLHEIAAAALLLLGDLTEDQQVDVMRAVAKRGITIVEPGNHLYETLREAWRLSEDAVADVDGSSGLGAVAAKNINGKLRHLRDRVRTAAQISGVRPNWK